MATDFELFQRIGKDVKGRLPVATDGSVTVAGTPLKPLANATGYAYTITDEAGRIALGVTDDGRVHSQPTDSSGVTEVHAFILAGQSNMSGRARPFTGRDTPDRRVFQYGATHRIIERASVPLDMHDTPAGMSYATVFAREYLATQPEGVAVLLIPTAHGGTGFTTTTENPPPAGMVTHAGGTWQVGYTGSAVNLYDLMLAQTAEAITAGTSAFGVTPVVKGLLWHQGEADAMNSVAEATYSGYLDALIDGTRAALGNSRLPVVIGGMSPDWSDTYATAGPIINALTAMVVVNANVAYHKGIPGTGRVGDEIHYGLDGIDRLGRDALRAYYAAIANHSDYTLEPPPTATATRVGSTITVSWERPMCRVSHYDVQWRANGGAWTEIAFPSTHRREATITTAPTTGVEVRVGTDLLGTVAWGRPVTVIGG
ncbi:sialate O-acetylesterase [Brachybacterium sp. SGAir0954]|uniref:sialate O-acetylesterase n=1 Tax=Brachybacterium sp. SGAir0954 TaxID=2571029 RepID=UPI00143CE378|nr:sialate O-acetylesterase [Brachybacterium sp. SGAir0954]